MIAREKTLQMVVLSVLSAAAVSVPSADTIRVPEDVTLIADALELASPGDTISVGPGGYDENLIWPATMGIKLLSRVRREAVITGITDAPVINITTMVGAGTVIEGFVIQGGGGEDGGGIRCVQASPTIADNHIRENSVTLHGGGISCTQASPLIARNLIESCSADQGGGLYWDETSDPTAAANTISSCMATQGGGVLSHGAGEIIACEIQENSGEGAGIFCSGTTVIDSCRIISNHGRGLHCEGAATVRNSLIQANQTGGIHLPEGSTALIEGNEIAWHSADDGAGILCLYAHPTIRANDIHHNDSGLGLAGAIYIHGGAPIVERNQITYNNTDYEASGIYCCADSTQILHNVISHNTCDQIVPNVGSGIFI
ncbi:right-handed parallel beta-helix repeat-containing protein [Candidatus Eisenbacteria bacterium]|uniref:Right-handed parallel beta-helix repeat-containing protein n=1 Tax=Eiseniibacteriota bacterium TaxID=2212470 RepID=A0ABV6YK67_UNCEI